MGDSWIYDGENFVQIQTTLGPRPGGYRVDTYYLRYGMGRKPYFWDEELHKWQRLKIGDLIWINEETGFPIKSGVSRGETARQPAG